MNAHGTDDKRKVARYSSTDCSGDWSYQHVGGSNIFYSLEFRDGYVYAANYKNETYEGRTETFEFSIGDCSKTITLCQDSATPPVSCREIVVDGYRGVKTSDAYTFEDSSHIADNALFVIKVWTKDYISPAVLDSRDIAWEWIHEHESEATTYGPYGKFDTDQHGPITLHHTYIGGTEEGGTFWPQSQCVAAKLRYQAYGNPGDPYPNCMLYHCPFGCYPAGAHSDPGQTCDSDDVCSGDYGLGGWFDENDPLLSYANYQVTANNTGKDRLVTIHWFRPQDSWDACPSALIAVLQQK
jgi:hypothetical protein